MILAFTMWKKIVIAFNWGVRWRVQWQREVASTHLMEMLCALIFALLFPGVVEMWMLTLTAEPEKCIRCKCVSCILTHTHTHTINRGNGWDRNESMAKSQWRGKTTTQIAVGRDAALSILNERDALLHTHSVLSLILMEWKRVVSGDEQCVRQWR